MEIKVTVNVEDMASDTPNKVAISAFFTFVALDVHGVPREIPQLKPITPEEEKAFELGRKRYEANKAKSK